MRRSFLLRRPAVSGAAAVNFYQTLRSQIIADLAGNQNDKSLAGRVDTEIAELVSFINATYPQYVTSSSCAGRVSLFHKGTLSPSSSSFIEADATAATATENSYRRKRGSFGRGAIYQSHDIIAADPALLTSQFLTPALEDFWRWRQEQPVEADTRLQETEILQLKYEPMILHLLCEDIEAAAALLQCASESGQMQSGIVSCSRGTKEYRKIVCSISSPLCLDMPLFTRGSWVLPQTDFAHAAWQHVLTRAMAHVQLLFHENITRRNRFEAELQKRVEPRRGAGALPPSHG